MEKKQKGSRLESDDHDVTLIKVLTGSLDFSEFKNLEESLHFFASNRSNWHLLPALNHIGGFQAYCEYLKTEASKLISKQTKAQKASLLSYPIFLKDESARKVVRDDIFERFIYGGSTELRKQLDESKEGKHSKTRIQFLRWLRDENSKIMDMDVNIVVSEAAVFAEEWMSTAVLLHRKNKFSKLADPLASNSIRPYDFAVSYVFYEIESLLAPKKSKLSSKGIFNLICLYWIVNLAKANQLLANKIRWEDEAKQDLVQSKVKLKTFDDFILSETWERENGTQLRHYRAFMRNVIIKAWIHLQTKDNPLPQYVLAADLEKFFNEHSLGMSRAGILSLVNDLLKKNHLCKQLPKGALWSDNGKLQSYIKEITPPIE